MFSIIALDDTPLYTVDLSPTKREDSAHLNQFIVHAALDLVEERAGQVSETHLRTIDKFNDINVSAYVTPGQVRFVLLHQQDHKDAIKQFFSQIAELYVKVLLNPFYRIFSPIKSSSFDAKVKSLSRKLLQ
jgi:hypothetical protein